MTRAWRSPGWLAWLPLAWLPLAWTLASACGGPPAPHPPARPLVDAGPPDAAPPPDARPVDHCGGYQLAIGPSLGRIEQAADTFLEALRLATHPGEFASAARAFADALDLERASLASIATGDPTIDQAHAGLIQAITDLTAALRVYAVAYEGHDQSAAKHAAAGLDQAIQAWLAAVDRMKQVCPRID